jgi:hypothetical protein
MDPKDRPIEDLKAGDDFRRSLIPRADGDRGGAPLWHGWALMDAFLAGVDHARRAGQGGL